MAPSEKLHRRYPGTVRRHTTTLVILCVEVDHDWDTPAGVVASIIGESVRLPAQLTGYHHDVAPTNVRLLGARTTDAAREQARWAYDRITEDRPRPTITA